MLDCDVTSLKAGAKRYVMTVTEAAILHEIKFVKTPPV